MPRRQAVAPIYAGEEGLIEREKRFCVGGDNFESKYVLFAGQFLFCVAGKVLFAECRNLFSLNSALYELHFNSDNSLFDTYQVIWHLAAIFNEGRIARLNFISVQASKPSRNALINCRVDAARWRIMQGLCIKNGSLSPLLCSESRFAPFLVRSQIPALDSIWRNACPLAASLFSGGGGAQDVIRVSCAATGRPMCPPPPGSEVKLELPGFSGHPISAC